MIRTYAGSVSSAAKATPRVDILDRKSVHGSRATCSLDGYSTRLTSSADPAFATSAG